MADGSPAAAPLLATGAATTAASAPGHWLPGVFLISAATLHLEILQTRIFSLVMWHHVTYLVVTFTLLGFAASGTLLSLLADRVERAPGRWMVGCSLAFAATSAGAFALLARSDVDTLKLLEQRIQYLWVFAYYLYLVVPYVFAGLAIGIALKVAGPRTGLVYGVNLAGSAAGCLLFAPLLRELGGSGSVLAAAAVAALAAAAFAGPRAPVAWIAVALAIVLGLVAGGAIAPKGMSADALIPLEPAKGKPVRMLIDYAHANGQAGAVVESTAWDPICRIDVVDLRAGDGHRRVFQDGDAPTEIFPAAATFDPFAVYCLPYVVGNAARKAVADAAGRPPEGPEVLAIGIGGGQDLRQAVWNGARKTTGVEINATTVEMMNCDSFRGQPGYRSFSGDVYHLPGVEVVTGEGRSYVRRSDAKYDLIQMTGTDTYTALASGSYVMSESYLYTLDAFRDYFDHLKPGGMVSVLRFRFFPPRESLRLVAIGTEALKRRGVAHPEQCILVVDMVRKIPSPDDPTKIVQLAYAAMMFRETPFGPAEIDAAKQWIATNPANQGRTGAERVFSLAYAPGEPPVNEFGEYLAAAAAGREEQFRANYPYKIEPVSDDSPFFFHFHRWSSLLEEHGKANYFSMTGRDPIGLFLLLTALGESALLVALLVILPLALSKRTRLPRERRVPVLAYFLGLGCGYLFLEVSAMQRFVLYLGHPSRSISVVLFTFLLFSGLGAAVAGRRRRSTARGPLLAIVALSLVYAFGLPAVLQATLGLTIEARIATAVALLAPLAFVMGMPFPTGLARLTGEQRAFLPWAFAINGGASVVASVVAIFVAMETGFTTVFGLAAATYLLAWLVARRLPEANAA
jgi:hypothetical protein